MISKYSEKTIFPDTYAIKENVIATIITGTIAKPSKPSVKFTAFAEPTKIFVMPLGGNNSEEIIEKLKEFSFMIRKVLSKKIVMKFLPKLYFVKDDSFDYAEKIENLIKQTNK